jgi:hypothetical protein
MPDVLVASGFATSSAFLLNRPTFAIMLPNSTTATQVRLQFATDLTATSAGFATLQNEAGTAPWVAFSGSGPLASAPVPAITHIARLWLSGNVAGPSSYAIVTLTS